MKGGTSVELICDFLGSAQIFSSAVNEFMEEHLRRVAEGRLTFPQLKVLKLVAAADARTISDVAAFLGVSSAAASKAVDRLVRRRLLRRAEAEADRRAIELSLTEGGRRLLREYELATGAALEEIFARFPSGQLRQAADLLDRISVRIIDHEAGPEEVCYRCGIYFRDKCLLRQLLRTTCHYHRRLGTPAQEALTARGGDGGRGADPRAPGRHAGAGRRRGRAPRP